MPKKGKTNTSHFCHKFLTFFSLFPRMDLFYPLAPPFIHKRRYTEPGVAQWAGSGEISVKVAEESDP